MDSTNKWVPPLLTIFKLYCVLSLQIEEIEKNQNGEDLNSPCLHLKKIRLKRDNS